MLLLSRVMLVELFLRYDTFTIEAGNTVVGVISYIYFVDQGHEYLILVHYSYLD